MERRALADLTLGPDAPAMLLDDPAADEEPEAHAVEAAIVDVRSARETIEDVRQIGCGDTDPAVLHREPRLALLLPHPHGDRVAVWTVFARVLEQVLQQLLDASPIPHADDRIALLELHLRLLGHALAHLARDRREIDRLAVGDQLSAIEPVRVEQIRDLRGQSLPLAHDSAYADEVRRRGRLTEGLALEELGLRDDGRERGPQIVRGGGEEILLEPGGLLLRAHRGRVIDERAALEDHRGLIREQARELDVAHREDRWTFGEEREHAKAPLARGDGDRDHGADESLDV